MSELSNLSEKLRDTNDQIVRFTAVVGENPEDKADALNLLSLQRRRQRLEQQINQIEIEGIQIDKAVLSSLTELSRRLHSFATKLAAIWSKDKVR